MRIPLRSTLFILASGALLACGGCRGTDNAMHSPFEEDMPLGPNGVAMLIGRSSENGVGGFEFADQSPDMVEKRAKSAAWYRK